MTARLIIEQVSVRTSLHDQTMRAAWRWRCLCHGLVSPLPWAEQPRPENAAAEHDWLVGARPVPRSGGWAR